MYDEVITSVRIIGGETNTFPIIIYLHQGFGLSPTSVHFRHRWYSKVHSR